MPHPDASLGPRSRVSLWALSLSVLAGVLLAACLAWPVALPLALSSLGPRLGQPLWWGALLAVALLAWLQAVCTSWRMAALCGWLFATAHLAFTFGWLFTSMHTYGGLPAPLAVLAVLALAGFLALYYAAAGAAYWVLAPTHPAMSALVFAATWLLAELARGTWLTGFGWGGVGYALVDGPFRPLIPWLGVYGTGAVAAAVAALVAMTTVAVRWCIAWRCPSDIPYSAILALLAIPVILWLMNMVPLPTGGSSGPISVTLLQGNIAQSDKFDNSTGVPVALRYYGEQLNAGQSSLIVTPETALPQLPLHLPAGYLQALQQRFGQGTQAALVGIPLGGASEGYTNSIMGIKPGMARPWHYHKHHLVPFGEFTPPLFKWFTRLMNIPLGDFDRGGLAQPTFDWQGQRLAATICYENLFGEEIAAGFADPHSAPTILVNISNLGWFGDHLAMDQHLQITRMRALEFDRPFLLSTNTGHTAIVDHLGQVTYAAPPHTQYALTGQVTGRTGLTPFAKWVAHYGLWPLWLLAIAVLLTARNA